MQIIVQSTNAVCSNSQSGSRSAEESDGDAAGWRRNGNGREGTAEDQREAQGEKGQGNAEAVEPIRPQLEKV